MNLRPRLQIQAALKAMREVIIPALDPDSKMAQEQALLVVGMLNLLAQTLPLAYRYDRDELSRWLRVAQTLQDEGRRFEDRPVVFEALSESAKSAADVLDRARAGPEELESAVADMRARIGEAVTAVFALTPEPAQRAACAHLLAASAEQLVRERAWVLCQGWESSPQTLPDIESLI